MQTLIATTLLVLLAMLALGVGVLLGRGEPRGSCGGIACNGACGGCDGGEGRP
ncbi:hypothetical protein [Bosea sp. (in: a-proteobacteria)]|uniref:hypothetical protein n=1 Tax=Bosea sp. (in: a-proteobacteria) TaxID=1871050 RepID=UPI00261809C2|nr:hypothetical protein [Bosea sp. (in: a-proteobacteria)]MCO5093573.1 hypothetical protein [Bosea sp. (in: a-proteobacteria)]